MLSIPKIFFGLLVMVFAITANSQVLDLSRAQLQLSPSIKSPFRETLIKIIQEEIFKRTSLKFPLAAKANNGSLITLVLKDDITQELKPPVGLEDTGFQNKPEGFRIAATSDNSNNILWLIANDQRALLFAVGRFLSTADLSTKKILFNTSNEIATAPAYPIRGHQIGYRNTANSWDAWTVAQYDQYIRELALFGTNSIENIPFQGGKPGPLMKVPQDEMNIAISRVCDNYDLNYWVWTPVDADLADSSRFHAEVKKHAAFYKQCPRLDDVFVPGGDPGDNEPEHVMPFLEAISTELKKYHPEAGVWVSLQGFNDRQVDYFYDYLQKHDPDWLRGVVTGPGSPDIAATRFRLPAKYKHRAYPDLTHSLRCQYPVQNWDQAFALTEGREVCNPRPIAFSKIFRHFAPFTDGFISYSDGVHDDVNKVLWTQLSWDPSQDVYGIVKGYSKYFFGTDATNEIYALEKNWDGPMEDNAGIETTFQSWTALESKHPELANNWRWQLLVMRSYYDTYTKRRKAFEQNLEKEANIILSRASIIGAAKTMTQALAIVNKADEKPFQPEMKQKITGYCASLFRSIGLQTSVKEYQASGAERGAILDFLDYPLNNRWWLADEFAKVDTMKSEEQKFKRINIISKWERPGEGSYYDNISNIAQSPHVKSFSEDATDVAWWDNGRSRKRLSTQLFQNFPELVYEDLDPAAHYMIRIAGEGDALLRIDGERAEPTLYNKELEQFKEFPVASRLYTDGKLVITFDHPEESHLNWRRHSKVCDIWLLKY